MESTFEEDYKYLLEIFDEQVISDRFILKPVFIS